MYICKSRQMALGVLFSYLIGKSLVSEYQHILVHVSLPRHGRHICRNVETIADILEPERETVLTRTLEYEATTILLNFGPLLGLS